MSANEASVCTQEASTVPPMGNCGWTCRGEAGRGSGSLRSLLGLSRSAAGELGRERWVSGGGSSLQGLSWASCPSQ